VTNVDFTHSALDTTGGGSISVHSWIGGSINRTYITTASAAQVHAWNPAQSAVGYRLTSSGQLVIQTQGVGVTGTASVLFTVVVQYTTTEDPD
jgi:hypothetical protein